MRSEAVNSMFLLSPPACSRGRHRRQDFHFTEFGNIFTGREYLLFFHYSDRCNHDRYGRPQLTATTMKASKMPDGSFSP
jgi:hypothetical protein